MRPARVLILTAAIGAGHDLPAQVLSTQLRAASPAAEVTVVDGLEAMGALVRHVILGGSSVHSTLGSWLYELEYWLIAHLGLTRRLAGWLLGALGGRGLLRRIERERPDVVVSTYPGVTEALGRLRRAGRLDVPVISAITDLAGLRFWAHPGVDLHLVTHAESVDEVRAVAGPDAAVLAVRDLTDPAFLVPCDQDEARRALGLPIGPKVVLVSGGGWGVGDIAGAIESVLEVPDAIAVVLCGTNEALRRDVRVRFPTERVRPLPFTDRMPELLAAADALVHATAGLTVLEAAARGCPAISYGWGRGHIRANNRAFVRHGLADVAPGRSELAEALERALAERRVPDASLALLPSAAAVVLSAATGAGLG